MDKINFLAGEDFPVSTNTFDRMQQATLRTANLALLGGVNYILSGCETNGTAVASGLIVIAGELLPFQGGETKAKVAIVENKTQLEAFDTLYPEAYIDRIAVFADEGPYSWADFKQVLTNKQLEERIADIKGDPVGVIKEFAGPVTLIPDGYLPCDGRPLSSTQYPELFATIRYTYGGDGNTQFNLPNFNGRVSVGYDAQNNEYDLGRTGGVEKVTLTVSQIPEHRHAYTDDTNAQGKYPQVEDGFPVSITGIANVKSSAESSGWGTVYNSSKVGEGKSHENRQPFLAVSKMIKVK